MSMFRAKKLDLGCFVKVRTLRDHTKRKVFEEYETERCANSSFTTDPWDHPGNDEALGSVQLAVPGAWVSDEERLLTGALTGKLSDTSSATRPSLLESAPKPSCN